MGRFVLIFALFACAARAQCVPAPGYSYCRAITVPHAEVALASAGNFPVAICGSNLSASCTTSLSFFESVANGGRIQNSSCYDVTFTSDSGGTTVIPYEAVQTGGKNCNLTTGAAFMIVLANISPTVDSTFYVSMGNSSISTDQSNKTTVWDSNFLGVYHMGDGTTLNVNDSTSNGNNGTNHGMTETAGPISGAIIGNGTSAYVDITGIPSQTFAALTAEIMVYRGSGTGSARYFGNGNNATPSAGFEMMGEYGYGLGLSIGNGLSSVNAADFSVQTSNAFALWSGVYDGTYAYIYRNGTLEATSGSLAGPLGASGNDVNIGRGPYGNDYSNQAIGEVRLSKIARSAGWIQTTANNLTTPANFFSVGPEGGTPTLACPAVQAFASNSYISSFVVSGGVGPYTYSIASGSLPTGVSLNTSTGALTGSPGGGLGTSTFTGHVVDTNGRAGTTSSCSITVSTLMPVTFVGATETQVVLNYTAPNSGPCTISGVENVQPASTIWDANTLIANATTDTLRTWANGFRWLTLSNGLNRTIVLGGHDEVKQGTNGWWYATELQVGSDKTFTISCNSGQNIGVVHVATENLPAGSYYPELPIPTPGSPLGGLPQPTIDWTVAGRNTVYNDLITGIPFQRITGTTDNFNGTTGNNYPFQTGIVFCADGTTCSAWGGSTNALNLVTNLASGTLASTSSTNSYIFAPFNNAIFNVVQNNLDFTDFIVIPYGSSTAHTEVGEFCISQDSGQTCGSGVVDVTYSNASTGPQPTGVNLTSMIPTGFPHPNFTGWGGGFIHSSGGWWDLNNRIVTGVSASGSVVSMITPADPGFNLNRNAGTKYQLTSCSSGANTVVTLSSYNSAYSINVVETGLSLTNCTLTEMAVGVRAILKTAGTINMSLGFDNTQPGAGFLSQVNIPGSNGARWLCGTAKVNDISTDCSGNLQSPPLSGYLCALPQGEIYLLQDNGVSCLQSNLYDNERTGVHLEEGGLFTGPNTFLGATYGGSNPLYMMTHLPNYYKEACTSDINHTCIDNFTYTNVNSIFNPNAQVTASGSEMAALLTQGFGFSSAPQAYVDNGTNPPYAQFFFGEGGGDASLCGFAWTNSSTGALVNQELFFSIGSYVGYPFNYGACHTGGQSPGGGYTSASVSGPNSERGPIKFSSAVLLGGPFDTHISGQYRNGVLYQHTITITSCTNATPAVCTSANSDVDNQPNATQGTYAVISGASGSWATMNGTVYLHAIDQNTFSVYTDSKCQNGYAGNATSTGSITATMGPALYSMQMTSVANVSGTPQVTVSVTTGGFAALFPSETSPIGTCDPVTVTGSGVTALLETNQYYAAKITNTTANIYTDAACSVPASYSTINALSGGYVTYAEACPAQSSVTLPGPLYTDLGFWNISGHPYIRCYTIQVTRELCSDFPASGEQANFPCSSDPSNTALSATHPIALGDGLGTLHAYPGQNWNYDYVVAVNRTGGEHAIAVTAARCYGNDPAIGALGTVCLGDNYAMQRPWGWTPWGGAVLNQAIVNIPNLQVTATIVDGDHYEIVPGSVAGNTTTAVNPYVAGGAPDPAVDISIAAYATLNTKYHNNQPFWSVQITNNYGAAYYTESYPSKRIRYNQTPVSEQGWSGDWLAQNAAFGNSQNNGDGIGWSRTLVLQGGTAHVYKIPVIAGATNIKVTPVVVQNIPTTLFVDISGPANCSSTPANAHCLQDANPGDSCTAYATNECFSGWNAGDTGFSSGNIRDAGQCIANEATLGSPCAFGLWAGVGWAVQVQQKPLDVNGTHTRRLTMGGWLAPNHYSFSNWITTPDGKWGIWAENPFNERPYYRSNSSMQWFRMRLPGWPAQDTVNRTTYVNVPITSSGAIGDTVEAKFGYGENGNPANFYCTSRQETCWTSATATAANPFRFDGETASKNSCSGTPVSCQVNIPAIAGRILFYEFCRTPSGGSEVCGPLQVQAIP